MQWCPRRDSNPQSWTGTGSAGRRVCQFRHGGSYGVPVTRVTITDTWPVLPSYDPLAAPFISANAVVLGSEGTVSDTSKTRHTPDPLAVSTSGGVFRDRYLRLPRI